MADIITVAFPAPFFADDSNLVDYVFETTIIGLPSGPPPPPPVPQGGGPTGILGMAAVEW